MRILLILTSLILVFSIRLSAQNDFRSLDMRSYDYYLKGDYKNLQKIADTLLSIGSDYYYLRMRLGILSFNNQSYFNSIKQFVKATEFNSSDTLSKAYIYYCYLNSGRKADAMLYLESVPYNLKNNLFKASGNPFTSVIYIGSSASSSDVTLYNINRLYYESVKNSLSINGGFESFFLKRFKGTFAITNYRKSGTVYSSSNPSGTDLNFSQNQVYVNLTGYAMKGWEFSLFGHSAFYNNRIDNNLKRIEYIGGLGISKSGWKIRAGANFSLSNFSNSNQMRGEGYFVYLPYGNLNLYFTTGGMYQNDINWGPTYQVDQEIGFKLLKFLWLESGIVKGNSFLYARNQGYSLNNSFLIPSTTVYGNIVILPAKKISITISPFYMQNNSYSWNLSSYSRGDKLTLNSFGGEIRLIYKSR